jgi:hypothetical protein
MNCHEVQSKIAQIDGDSSSPVVIAHARECAACHQSLREVLGQQKWLRERFADVSEDLLAHAPPLWGAAFQERLRGPALPAPLLPLAWAALLLGTAALGWWTWTSSPTNASKSSVAERHVPRESAEKTPASANHRAHSKSIPSLSEFESLGSASASSWPAETGPVWTLPEQSAVPQPSRELAVSQSLSKSEVTQSSPEPGMAEASPEVAMSEPSSPAKFRFDTGVFQMEPTALAPGASGYLAAIIPKDSTDQTTAMVALSLTGLPTKSVFYVRTKDVGGNQVSLGSGRTDINGSAVAVMLRSSPTRAAVGAPTLSVASTEPPVTLNFDGATGEDLEVVDTAGNVLMTVGAATKPKVVSRVNPSPTP